MPTPTDPTPRAPLALYFALALGITNGALLPPTLAALGFLDADPEALMAGAPLAIFGPTIAAVVAARREGGGPAVRALLGGLRAWRVPARWYVLALGIPTAVILAGRAGYALFPGSEDTPWVYLPRDPQRIVAAVLVPLGEEIGWRGYALPRLIARHGVVRATVVLGLGWAVWHFGMLVSVGTPPALLALMPLYFVSGSFLFTWMYQRTGGNLLLAVLLHVGAHLANTGQFPDAAPTVIATVGYTALAIGLVALDREAFRDAR